MWLTLIRRCDNLPVAVNFDHVIDIQPSQHDGTIDGTTIITCAGADNLHSIEVVDDFEDVCNSLEVTPVSPPS